MGFDLGLGDVFRAVWRGKWIVLVAVIAGVAAMAGLLTQLTPRFTAEAAILIGAPEVDVAPGDEVVEDNGRDAEAVHNAAFVLKSESFADRVISKLGLGRVPEFSPADDKVEGDRGALDQARRRTAVIEKFLDRLRVSVLPESRVIRVSFTSTDPRRAATVTNAIAETYLVSRREDKAEFTRSASTWLLERIENLRAEVEAGEQAVEKMREEYSLLSTGGVTLASQRLAQLNDQLLRTGTARAEAEARLGQVKRAQESGADGNANSQILSSPLIQRLREQQAQVERRIAELGVEFGEKHPRMIQARAEARDIAEAIDAEIDRIVKRLENEVAVARAQEEMLTERVEEQKRLVAQSNRKEIELRALERDVASNRQLLDALLARQKETVSRDDIDFQSAGALILSKAFVPVEPSFPNRPVMLGLAVLGSGLLGLLLVLLRELLDRGFRSGEEIEKATGITSLGFLPYVRSLSKSDNVSAYLAEKPNSAYGEAIRTLGWSVSLIYPDAPPTVVMLTSSEPGEGKTTVAAALATLRAQAGGRSVIVDADTRRPAIHRLYGVSREPGLTDLLTGQAKLPGVVHSFGEGKPDVVCAGRPDQNSADLLGSSAMVRLLEELGSQYDLVVVDSPPVLAGVDARILSIS